jgi:superfamily II DNA/RNA helicase
MQGETSEKERDKREALQAQLAALKRGMQNDWIAAVPASARAIKRLAGTVSRSRDIDGERVVDILLAILDDVNAITSFEQRIDQLRDPSDRMAMHDDKMDALVALLKQHPGDKFLIFTQFKDTAAYIEHALRREGIGPLVSVHGQMRANDKEDAMTAFCPKYAPKDVIDRVKKRHGGNIPRSIRIMVATDAMSQSVNLQEARRVINYDLPWNPMIMYQRNGRARRVDNPNPVNAYNFVPDAQIDEALGLIDLLKGKLDIIAKVIGLSTKLLSKDDDPGDDPVVLKEAFKERLARIRSSAGWAIDVERAETDEVSAFLRSVVAARGWRREDARELPRVDGKVPYTIAKGPPGIAIAFCTVSVEKADGARDRLHHATILVDVSSGTPAKPGTFHPPPSIDTVPRPLSTGELAAIKGIVESGAASIASSAAASLRETKQTAAARVQAQREKNKLTTILRRGSLFSKTVTRETQEDKEIKAKARKAVIALQRKELATNDLLPDVRAFSSKWLDDKRALAGDVLISFYADLDDIANRVKDAGESIAGKKIVASIDGIAIFRS